MGSQVSVVNWGILALPNDVRKRNKLTAWMFQNLDVVIEACKELREEGLLM